MVLIYLDAGHGGKDAGAVGNNLREKDITLSICKLIEKGLRAYDCQVHLSRTTDEYLTLDQRTIKANKLNADVLVSVHVNSATSNSADGFESYVYPNPSSSTQAFQNVMHQEIMKTLGSDIADRGKKQRNFHMLRESKMKAILTENLFISNITDAKLLANSAFIQKVANAHILGLEKFLGLKKTGAQPPPINNKFWVVQIGAFEEKKLAQDLAAQLMREGYKPFIKEE